MKLIIDIDEEIYQMICNTGTYGNYRFNSAKAIKEGTPLPKGHGRLIDADKLRPYEYITKNYIHIDELDNAPTIIEADKEVEE